MRTNALHGGTGTVMAAIYAPTQYSLHSLLLDDPRVTSLAMAVALVPATLPRPLAPAQTL